MSTVPRRGRVVKAPVKASSNKTGGMKFIARQPIFDVHQKVYGYELLFRSGTDNFYDAPDVDHASLSVIANGVLFHVIEDLTENRKAFVNFGREALVGDYAFHLPKECCVVEVLEVVDTDKEIVAALQRLRAAGYSLALDDVVSTERLDRVLDLIHIVKVDMTLSTLEQRTRLVELLAPRGIFLLAEKVENPEQFQEVAKLGFHYFQGFFFAKPQMIARRDIPAFQTSYLRMLQAIHRSHVDRKEIERIIRQESAFCYKLLRYLNSPVFGFRSAIRSIRHAISMLGEREIKNWASMLALTALAGDSPEELTASSLRRAHFCESVASPAGMHGREDDLFLMGLLSLIDAVLCRPKTEIFSQLPIHDDIKSALLHGQSKMAAVLLLVEAYEQADWQQVTNLALRIGLEEQAVMDAYLKSVEWTREVMQLG
jgi:c-di-GMP-related signal transduction protein